MNSDTGSLRETEIRPNDLMEGQAERFAADVKRLIAQKSYFVNVSCPACGENKACVQFEKYEMSYVKCYTCETLYINPRPPSSILDHYYATSENYNYWNKYIFPASEEVRRNKIFRPRAQKIADIACRYRQGRGTLIEVGAGFGIFCEEITALNVFDRIIGIEPTPDLAQTCRLKGLEIIENPVEHIVFPPNSIDVIASFEVIEHLFSPEQFVRWCADALTPGGLLVLTCPNVKGFEVAVLQEASDTIDIEHLNYFHPDSLKRLVTRCGMEVVEITTPGKLDVELVRKKVLEGKINLYNQPFLNHILVENGSHLRDAFQKFIAENKLSSHMWIVARKPIENCITKI